MKKTACQSYNLFDSE